jgi:hypothetical protein
LRRGGRLALLVWQEIGHNEWTREIFTALAAGRDLPAPPDPFLMSDPDRVRAILDGAGYTAGRVDGAQEHSGGLLFLLDRPA